MSAPWLGPKRAARLAERFGTPTYAYSAKILRARCRAMVRAFPGTQIRYAMKANANPTLLRRIRAEGLGVDAVSRWEVRLAQELGFTRQEILYSGNNPDNAELDAVHRAGVMLNLDALSSLRRYGERFPNSPVSLRLNLEIGAGHHPHVVTAGPDSKFGLGVDELPEARAIARRFGLRITGLHQHIGSGVFELDLFLRAMEPLMALLPDFPALEFVDVGGGFGVPYRDDESPIDLEHWGQQIRARIGRAVADLGRPLRLAIEPGRYIVCESGVLVTRVTTVKRTRDRCFVGVDSGMHHLIRPALYQSFHPVASWPRRDSAPERCEIVGPICESGDVLAEDRTMPAPREGDLVVVGHAGAYGFAMSSHYNLRGRPAEVLVNGDDMRRIRARERYRDLVRPGDLRPRG
ncbi:MAG: diaminopimelate decarboxylase [Polyangiales bacterium]